ncbi:MAG TPA: BofC C-terminal domain-containing protein [Bacillota bacterium]|jgi:hypothetical protein|nr:BofC C-terminal domain-containing protein [Bacillota bacterium]
MNSRSKLLATGLILILLSAGLSYAYLSLRTPADLDKPDEQFPDLSDRLEYEGNASSYGLHQASIDPVNPAKIRSFTEIIYRTVYECGHEETNRIPAPAEMIGLSRDDLAKQIEGWTITEFSESQVVFFQKRQGMSPSCLKTMHIGEKDGWVTVFYGTPDNRCRPKSATRIKVSDLPPRELDDLNTGIPVSGEEELLHILEALASWTDG